MGTNNFGPEAYPVKEDVYCAVCDTYDCRKVAIPYVLRYMTNELAAMGIKLGFQLDNLQASN